MRAGAPVTTGPPIDNLALIPTLVRLPWRGSKWGGNYRISDRRGRVDASATLDWARVDISCVVVVACKACDAGKWRAGAGRVTIGANDSTEREDRSMYKKFRFIVDDLAGDIYYPSASSSSPRAAGIFLYGIPAFIGQNEVTYALINANMMAFQPHYYGTYDSGGLYSPTTVINTCRDSQSMFDRGTAPQTTKKNAPFSLPPLRLCVGHSFGTLAALRGVQYLTSLDTLVLLAPTVHYRKVDPDFGNTADGLSILESIRQGNPRTYRLAPDFEWLELMSGNDPLPKNSAHPTLRKVIAVAGAEDPYLKMSALEENLPKIVRAYCGPSVSFELIRVPNAGHNIAELTDVDGHFRLADVALRCAQ